ncbi:MAG TPA: aminopeptidase [Bdellovibrionota bacterium]|jgi:predicted aminopeptidase
MRFILSAGTLCLALSGCSSVGYLAESGIGQWKLFNRARPLNEIMASPNTSGATRHGIQMVGKAKAFAVNELGLKATKNYETFVQLDAPCVSWAVSASHPLLLEEKKWKFPIVGEIPYLGFFKKESAHKKAKELEEEETPKPDTWVRCVPAFSSLGWFPDPLYSSMITGKDHHIVDLVVHESLHATVWVKGSVDFNEKLANFVGLEGSIRYVEKERGVAGVAEVRAEVVEQKVFADFMKETVDRYKATVKTMANKETFYKNLQASYLSFSQARQKKGEKFQVSKGDKLNTWNNAALLAYSNYYSDYSVFERMLKKCGGSLGRFVAWIAGIQKKDEDAFSASPEEYLVKLEAASVCP